MTKRGVPAEVAAAILERIAIEGGAAEILTHLEAPLAATRNGSQGIARTMRELFAILAAMGVPAEHYRVDLRLVRGLDYYTGPIYEIDRRGADDRQPDRRRALRRPDRPVHRPTIPATGTTIGLERIIDVMKEFEMLPAIVSGPQLLVTVFDEASRPASLALAGELRRAGYRVEVPLQRAKGLKPQIAYASAKNMALVAIMGPDEIASGSVTLRAGPGNQRTVPRAQIADELRAFMDGLG